MSKKIPKNIEEKVIDLLKNSEKTVIEISKELDVSCAYIYVINRTHNIRDKQKKKYPRIPSDDMAWFRQDDVKEGEKKYLKNLNNRSKIRIDDSPIWRHK